MQRARDAVCSSLRTSRGGVPTRCHYGIVCLFAATDARIISRPAAGPTNPGELPYGLSRSRLRLRRYATGASGRIVPEFALDVPAFSAHARG